MKAFQPGEDSTTGVASYYDKTNEVKEFLERKTNIKELVDSGIVKVPRMFIHPPETIQSTPSSIQDDVHLHVPLIDFKGYQGDCRAEIVEEMRKASETWGMFQIINHGVPKIVMATMLESIRQFHEQPKEVKMEFYSNFNQKQKVLYYSSGSFSGPTLPHWRDTLFCILDDGVLDPKALPSICRDAIGDYIASLNELKNSLYGLLSEALGLGQDHLASIECLQSVRLGCHYFPPCPEPELTLGITKHTDPYFLTILLQDKTGGLQVLHKNHWVDVTPLEGALTINIGDLMQLITNDRFKSAEHRVLARRVGPRVSAPVFLYPSTKFQIKAYEPIKEISSPNEPPLYRETQFHEYIVYHTKKGQDVLVLPHFKI